MTPSSTSDTSGTTTRQAADGEKGAIVGTFQYMAPEQVEGREADARTDIFAFGAILYEMATGRRAFEGETKASLIAAILKEQPPPIAEAQPLTPPALQHVVDKCLEKDPDARWQSALDVASELRWISTAGSQAGVAARVTSSRARRSRILAVAAIAGWAVATAKWQVSTGGGAKPAWSADGRQLYYLAGDRVVRPRSTTARRSPPLPRGPSRPSATASSTSARLRAAASWPCARLTPGKPPLTLFRTGSSCLARSETVSDPATWPQGKLASAIAERGRG